VCAWDFGTSPTPRPTTVIQPASRPKLPVDVILGIGIDITGSSGPFADGIRGNVEALLRAIEAKAASLKTTVQAHGDEDDGQFPTLVADAAPVAEAVAAVQALHFDGGGDPPEHHLNAIEQLASTLPVGAGGRQRGALVLFTTADSKPARSGRTPEQIGAELQRKQLIVCLVGEPRTQLERVGHACGAFMFPINATPSPADMKRVAEQVAASIVASLTKGSTRPLTQPLTK
jgi:hypothetical protein